jgi:hypothetical protein
LAAGGAPTEELATGGETQQFAFNFA